MGFGAAEEAYPFFLKSARADWDGGGKQWAGLVYIGGTHPAASGGCPSPIELERVLFAGLFWSAPPPQLDWRGGRGVRG